jgi:hypothetical protein
MIHDFDIISMEDMNNNPEGGIDPGKIGGQTRGIDPLINPLINPLIDNIKSNSNPILEDIPLGKILFI